MHEVINDIGSVHVNRRDRVALGEEFRDVALQELVHVGNLHKQESQF